VAVRILVVDDDRAVRESLRRSLSFNGYSVSLAEDGVEALEMIAADRPDGLVLDVMMPRLDGLEVCRQLRSTGDDLPILVLTARDTVSERVAGLDAGADDYLPKPFDFAELVARVRALARRSAPAVPPVLIAGDLRLDPARRVAERGGRRLDLSPKEFAALECLLAAGGRVVSAEELLDRVWDEMADPFTTAVKSTIRRLRGKLGDPPVVETVREGGYRIGGQ
jgi:DNA-binding response OmpR family regulator